MDAMPMNHPLLIASICLFSLALPLERGAAPPNPFCGVRLPRTRGSAGSRHGLNRRFGRAMHAVSALVLALSFFGRRASLLFPSLDGAFRALDSHIALLVFLAGAGIAVFALEGASRG
jgi:hypothetical protein